MLSTIIFLGILLLSLLLYASAWGFFLHIGLLFTKAEKATLNRVLITTVALFAFQIIFGLLILFLPISSATPILVAECIRLLLGIAIPLAVIMRLFRLSLVKTVLTLLATTPAIVFYFLFTLLIQKPFLCDAYTAPTISMAPTLLSEHRRGTCSECGEISFSSGRAPQSSPARHELGICSNFHMTELKNISDEVFPADRFIVMKVLKPKRWDVVTYKLPSNPGSLHVRRVVGLPGETVMIDNGMVWINGKSVELPPELSGISYRSTLQVDSPEHDFWGSRERQAKLGPDEYFVLGDFSVSSLDSRFYGEGAAGHNPFAIPESHIVGVVTHRYGPSGRFRILR